ncbi:MAG: hypothetical protein A2542_00645 [Parcubacteria group bacterium RIFOXYD2_FULL_52_8]|nr:MAG: hypothetical protein A2542_00645 [Parcubacteria group bacterium RIFOXYD2_FULL_52_8]
MKSVSCIIPAYNEAGRIAGVLAVAHNHPLLSEVLVIDDASNDNTTRVVASFPTVRYLRHEHNKGKSAAIATGIKATSGELLLFLDADLLHLTQEDITKLLRPISFGSADVSISIRGNAPAPWHWLGIDYLSGERVLPRQLIDKHLEEIGKLPGFGLEVFMNELIIKARARIAIVSWPQVESPLKEKKYGFWRGIFADVRMMCDIYRTVSFFATLRQIVTMRHLRISK